MPYLNQNVRQPNKLYLGILGMNPKPKKRPTKQHEEQRGLMLAKSSSYAE
jgi:hypothetical protein